MPGRTQQVEAVSSYLSQLTPEAAVKKLRSLEYYDSHRALIKLASNIEDDHLYDGVRALACATYGWMPTILKHCDPEKFNQRKPIGAIRAADTIDAARAIAESMDELAPINSSWVGTSKFLHFLNPRVFPIWDRRVASNFGLKWAFQINKKKAFLSYFDFIHTELAKKYTWLDAVENHIEAAHAYSPSSVRCLELMLFEGDTKQALSPG